MNKTIITKENLGMYVFGSDVLVPRTWSTKLSADDDATTVNGVMSYEGCGLKAVLNWATSDRVIARQRVERTLKTIPTEITVPAGQAGKKEPRTLEDNVREMSDEEYNDLIARMEAARNNA